jgi:hypothetical protein
MTTAGAPVPPATARHLITGAEKGLAKTTCGWRTTGKNFPPFFYRCFNVLHAKLADFWYKCHENLIIWHPYENFFTKGNDDDSNISWYYFLFGLSEIVNEKGALLFQKRGGFRKESAKESCGTEQAKESCGSGPAKESRIFQDSLAPHALEKKGKKAFHIYLRCLSSGVIMQTFLNSLQLLFFLYTKA